MTNMNHVSLETALKLQKAGYKKATELAYIKGFDDETVITHMTAFPKSVPAPSIAELLEELPREWDGQIVYHEFSFQDDGVILRTDIDVRKDGDTRIEIISKTFADALGLLMEYLLVNKLV